MFQEEGGVQTFLAVLPGGDLGHPTFSTWEGNGKKSTTGHLSRYASDMGSENPLIQSVSKDLLST